jgi:dimethylhistidine N-methyltransferase
LPIEISLAVESDRLSIVRLTEPSPAESLAHFTRAGLSTIPKWLHCQFFYDEAGSRLFEQICDLPEYYITRTEDAILKARAEAMVANWKRAPVMIELGSGSSTKTRRLIEAMLEAHGALHYIPIDVSPTILEQSARELTRDYSALRVTGYAANYHHALSVLAARIRRPKLLVFLGSSLGNYDKADASALLAHMARCMRPSDRLLLGTDMVKERSLLEAAYDDEQGVTAAFNRNILVRINRELGADFDLDLFTHIAFYNPMLGRMEMHLMSRCQQSVQIPGAGMTAAFTPGETIHTENSHKYTVAGLHDLAAAAGFVDEGAWTDERGWFRVQRWRLGA